MFRPAGDLWPCGWKEEIIVDASLSDLSRRPVAAGFLTHGYTLLKTLFISVELINSFGPMTMSGRLRMLSFLPANREL